MSICLGPQAYLFHFHSMFVLVFLTNMYVSLTLVYTKNQSSKSSGKWKGKKGIEKKSCFYHVEPRSSMLSREAPSNTLNINWSQ